MFGTTVKEIVPEDILQDLSKQLSKYFLVRQKRIYNLILQVNSVDVAIELLNVHLQLSLTLDCIVGDYLHCRDSLCDVEEKRVFDKKFNKGKFEKIIKGKLCQNL